MTSEPERGSCGLNRDGQLLQKALQSGARSTFYVQLKTKAAGLFFHRCWQRPDQFDLLNQLLKTEGGLKAVPGEADSLLQDRRLNPQQAKVIERGHSAQLSFFQQSFGALLIALGHQAIEPRMLSVPGLDNDLSCFVARPARPATCTIVWIICSWPRKSG